MIRLLHLCLVFIAAFGSLAFVSDSPVRAAQNQIGDVTGGAGGGLGGAINPRIPGATIITPNQNIAVFDPTIIDRLGNAGVRVSGITSCENAEAVTDQVNDLFTDLDPDLQVLFLDTLFTADADSCALADLVPVFDELNELFQNLQDLICTGANILSEGVEYARNALLAELTPDNVTDFLDNFDQAVQNLDIPSADDLIGVPVDDLRGVLAAAGLPTDALDGLTDNLPTDQVAGIIDDLGLPSDQVNNLVDNLNLPDPADLLNNLGIPNELPIDLDLGFDLDTLFPGLGLGSCSLSNDGRDPLDGPLNIQESDCSSDWEGERGRLPAAMQNEELLYEIKRAALELGMDPNQLAGVIWLESGGRPDAHNGCPRYSATGLIQFTRTTAQEVGIHNAATCDEHRRIVSGLDIPTQIDYTIRYYQQRRWEAGMSDYQAYATVHHGNPYGGSNDDRTGRSTDDIFNRDVLPKIEAFRCGGFDWNTLTWVDGA